MLNLRSYLFSTMGSDAFVHVHFFAVLAELQHRIFPMWQVMAIQLRIFSLHSSKFLYPFK